MKNIPHIIDNRRKVLLDTLIEVSKDHDEISIATGYWDLKGTEALLPYLQQYKKIRLLIGRELLIPRHQLNEIEADFPDRDIFEDLQALKPDIKLNETIINLKKLIDSKVLEVKVFKKTFLHAKCYIFGNFKSTNAVGFIGSSNFTLNGLTHNFELNASEDDFRVVLYSPQSEEQENGHLSWFEEAWNDDKCIDWTGQFIELVDTSIHGEKLFSPYEMYIKTLDLMYSHLLIEDQDITPLTSRKLHAFQDRSVKQISWRLKKNGVAMLADSVGLGKTITAISVMKQYDKRRVVVIAPASLTEQWKTEIISENLLGITVVSLQNRAEIEKEIERDHLMPISLFVIDESHNLRTHGSQRFELISSWLNNNEDADVLLLTATPVNNSIDDLTNQILLGTRGEQDLLKVNVRNSEGVVKSRSFYDALSDIKRRISLNRQEGKDMKPIYEEARQVIDPVLREFVIRNTRQSIKAELGGHGLEVDGKEQMFPDIKISNISFDSGFYNSLKIKSLIEPIENASVETIQLTTDILIHPLRQLRLPTIEKFDTKDSTLIYKLYQYILSLSFVPYRTSMYDHRVYGKTLEDLKKIKFANEDKKKLARQLSMYGLLRIVLLKRFESSSYALLASVKKYQNRLKVFEDILKTKKVILNLTDITDIINEFTEDDYDELDLTDEDIIKQTDKLGIPVSEDTYDIKSLLEDIALERGILDSIVELAEAFKNQDKKLERFKETIDQITKANPERKILVFSFFSDTVNYLQESLQDKTAITSINSAFVSGKSKNDALKSADRFSPIARKGLSEIEKSGPLTYLFSTDVLAEGQNLQDCGLLINYDLHWNPVRMIQRNGRINRLGSLYKEIEVMNMVPHKELEQFLGLVSKLEDKISLIQATIGSDSSILGEEINSIHYKGIYDEDSALATKEYERLEKEADVFTDDQYVIDLKKFYETASPEQLNILRKIPTHKWGVVDQSKSSLAPEVVLFTETKFSNNDSQFTFYRNNEKAEAIDLLLAGEALQILRSSDKTRELDKISLDKTKQFDYVVKYGPQIARYDRDAQRLTPSQTQILEEARIAGWSSIDREKLQKLLTTRNIFQERRARKFTRKIRELIKEGKKSQADEILNSIKKTLPDIQEEIKVNSVNPIFGFVRDNR